MGSRPLSERGQGRASWATAPAPAKGEGAATKGGALNKGRERAGGEDGLGERGETASASVLMQERAGLGTCGTEEQAVGKSALPQCTLRCGSPQLKPTGVSSQGMVPGR